MNPFPLGPEVIERCETPRGELQLQQRGSHFEIIHNGVFLMATYNGESERLLLRAALEQSDRPQHVLIGGLGVGFSLVEALRDQRIQGVTVIEVEKKIIEWNRTVLREVNASATLDHRVALIEADLIEWLEQTEYVFDVICLDIDNGPDWTVTEKNRWLYEDDGIRQLTLRLRPTGTVAYWSASPCDWFFKLLRQHFLSVQQLNVDVGTETPDTIYVASRPTTYADYLGPSPSEQPTG